MGKSNDQVIGYKYFTNFLLFIGNPIEKMLGINFDKRGWLTPLVDENGNPLLQGYINSPSLYGETEGGVTGAVYLKTGTNDQEVVPFYKDYMESKDLQASAYPYQSYLAFKDFYVGNSGYMKEMLLWPKRIHVRNDGRAQWYDLKAEVGKTILSEYIAGSLVINDTHYLVNQYFKVDALVHKDENSTRTTNGSLEAGFAQSAWGETLTGDLSQFNEFTCSASLTMPDIDGICDVHGYVEIYAKNANVVIEGFFDIEWETQLNKYGRTYFTAKAPIKALKKIKITGSGPEPNPLTTNIFGGSVLFSLKKPRSGNIKSTRSLS